MCHEVFAGTVFENDLLRIHAEGIDRASFCAKAAEHASQVVDVKAHHALFDTRVIALRCLNEDAVGRASRSAHAAGDTARRTIRTKHQAVLGTVGIADFGLTFRVRNRRKFFIAEQATSRMLKGCPQTANRLENVKAFDDGHRFLLNNAH